MGSGYTSMSIKFSSLGHNIGYLQGEKFPMLRKLAYPGDSNSPMFGTRNERSWAENFPISQGNRRKGWSWKENFPTSRGNKRIERSREANSPIWTTNFPLGKARSPKTLEGTKNKVYWPFN